MKAPSKVVQAQIEKGTPLSAFAIEKLRAKGNEEALKANAHNIVLAMLEGKPIRQVDLDEAVRYYPDQAKEWIDSGGTVKEEKGLAAWTSIYRIAKDLGMSEQNIHQVMKRNPTSAPRPNSQGKFNRNEVREFMESKSRDLTRGSKDYKQKILEQEYRLKKVKADEAEGLVLSKAEAEDIFGNADVVLESVLTHWVNAFCKEGREEEALAYAKVQFQFWRNHLEKISS